MKIKSFFASLLALALLLSGCVTEKDHTPTQQTQPSTTQPAAEAAPSVQSKDLFAHRDFDTDFDRQSSALIQLNGDTAQCSSNAVQISGSTVTITDEGTYILTGTLEDGMIIVSADKSDKTQLVLDGVTIHSESCAPVYIAQADKVFITTAEGSQNALSGGDTFTAIDDNNIDGVIFSKEDLTLNGGGTLTVTSPAGHGIVSKDSLTVTSGTYQVNCAAHAMTGKDNIAIADGIFTLVSGKDGIHAENNDDATLGFLHIEGGTYDITAEGDGLSAGAYLQITDGTFQILTGGGSENGQVHSSAGWGGFPGGGFPGGPGGRQRGGFAEIPFGNTEDTADSTSIKGIKAAGDLIITGGSFTVDSADDAFHSNSCVSVSGGTFHVASGDDAFHADDTLTITGGTIEIEESYEGLEGLHILVSGGAVTLNASDDGLNAAGGTDNSGFTGGRDGMFGGGPGMGGMGGNSDGGIVICGGTMQITASGDGIDANGTLEITGGFTTVCGPTQGDTATLDYDISATISGGTFIGTGASGMAQTFSDSPQGVIAVNAGAQAAGTQIKLVDAAGNTVIDYAPTLDFNVIILSSPDVQKGETYTLYVGELSEDFTAN